MKFIPISFEDPWQPKKIFGNTAYYYNPETGQTKSEFVPNNKLSERKKEFSDWFKVHAKFRKKTPFGKTVLIRKKDYVKLSRDPLAPFEFSNISKRQGIVTQVLSANRLVIDGSYVVTVPGIQIPSKRNNLVEWNKAKHLTESLILNKPVYLGINTNNPYAENGDVLASVDFDAKLPNQQEEGWGIFDYFNISGYAVGAAARNIVTGSTIVGIGDRYSLSDTFTFTRLYHQIVGDAKTLSATGRGETEGEWYEKLAIDIIFDPVNFVSVQGKGISYAGRRLIKGARYMKPITLFKNRAVKYANSFESHIPAAGLGESVDTINRTWRRLNLLLEPAYYSAQAQLDFWNSMLAGMNPIRLLNIDPILKNAKNPLLKKTIALKVPGKPKGGYTYQEIEAFMKEFNVGQSNIGDVSSPNRGKSVWDPLLGVVNWQTARTQGALFIDGLKKGMDPAQAAERVHHFLPYDPRYLTSFEKAYLNRIFPYYTPQTRNVALQLEQLLKTPYKYTSIAKWQIQQREFAGRDQFKDYERNTIIQKIGEGKYIKLRFPTEDLTQIPERYSTWQRGLLSSTYPIWSTIPELYMNRNLFEDTRPSNDYPKYLMKKFLSREYYATRDFMDPNMPISEKVSKHVFGVGLITPDNRFSYKQALIDAGFSPSQADQDIVNTIRREKNFKLNSMRVLAKAQVQTALPEEQRDRPYKLDWGWDTFQYLSWGVGAGLANIATLVQSGKMGDKGIQDRMPPSTTIQFGRRLRDLDKKISGGNQLPTYELLGINLRDLRDSAADFLTDVLTDPLMHAGYVLKAGRMVIVDGKITFLSKEGSVLYAKINPVIASGRAEGLYGKQAAARMQIEADAKYLKVLSETPGMANKMLRIPGFTFFGRTVISSSKFSAAYKVLKLPVTVPLKGAGIVAKEVSDVMNPFKKYIADRMGASEKLKIYWKDNFQRQYDEWLNGVKELKKISRIDIEEKQNEAYRLLDVWGEAKRKHAADPTHGYFFHLSKLSKETSSRLTDFVELGKKDPSAQGVIDDFTKEMARMANEEIPRGLLSKTRQDYVARITLSKYKFLQGYTDPIMNKLHIKTPFAMHRTTEGTIAEFNTWAKSKYGMEVFEPNLFTIWRMRKAQHIEAVETYEFLRRLANEQGINKVWAPFLGKTYGVSKIPTIQDVLLPIETVNALERIPILRNHISTLHTKPGIFRYALDKYDWGVSFFKRNIINLNPGFVPKNTISSFHQSIMAGYYGVKEYLPQRAKNGIAFTTIEGRNVYAWELSKWYEEFKVVHQPGMAVAGTQELENALDRLGAVPRWATLAVEDLIRTRLFNAKVMEGMSPAQAGQYVINHHLDYTKQYSPAMRIAARFIMFPTWATGAPVMVGRSMIERPWQFAITSKIIDAWNSPSDEMMLRYRPESMNPHMMFKVPGTEDAFYAPPLATTELLGFPVIIRTKDFQFYWKEALTNPNTLKRFARANLDVDWLKRGGGKAEVVNGNQVIITYVSTGEQIRAYLSGHNTLVFIDGNTNLIIKEFETMGKGNRVEIVKQGEPINELARRYFLPWFPMAKNAIFPSQKYPNKSTGNPTQDALNLVIQLSGLGALVNDIKDWIDEDTPLWAKIIDNRLGIIWFAQNALGLEREPDAEKVRRARININGNYRGCGW